MGGLGGGFPLPLGGDSGGALSVEEVRAIFLGMWPPGASELYDWDNADSDVAKYIDALADALKQRGADAVDNLRTELQIPTAVEKVDDWQKILGLALTPTAQSGTPDQRRNQIIAKLRESGSYSRPDVRAIIGPLLGYSSPNDLVIIECDRAALRALHTYAAAGGALAGGGAMLTQSFNVTDDAAVSVAGAVLSLVITHPHPETLSFALTGPVGIPVPPAEAGTVSLTNGLTSVVGVGTYFKSALRPGMQITTNLGLGGPWLTVASVVDNTHLVLTAGAPSTVGPVAWTKRLGQASIAWSQGIIGPGALVAQTRKLFGQAAAGYAMLGAWTLVITNNGVDAATIGTSGLFVEGVGKLVWNRGVSPALDIRPDGDGRGAEVYHWGVYADPAKIGIVSPADYSAVLQALGRIKPAHTRARLITSYRNAKPGSKRLIPGRFVPHHNP